MTVVADFTTRRGSFGLSFSATLEPGSVVAVIGPNGAGKSTLLRTLAGLHPVESGRLSINGSLVDDGRDFVPPQDRSVAVVFQDYALFPHLTVLENVAFGPRSRGAGRQTAHGVAGAALASLGIADLADRRPADISGGQAQRVALARAIVTEPTLLLLDEPLAALDAETRERVRTELDVALADFAGCTVLVTHDPLDALLLADRVIVLEEGRIVQDAPPEELARRPLTPYVAALMGVTLLRGTAADGLLSVDGGGVLHLADHHVRGRALAVVRPEAVTLHLHEPEGSARNAWRGRVASLQPAQDRVRVLVDGEPSVIAVVTPAAIAELGIMRGTPVWLSLKAVDVDVYSTPAH
jgi:molybdate transport system ATP-binding protein